MAKFYGGRSEYQVNNLNWYSKTSRVWFLAVILVPIIFFGFFNHTAGGLVVLSLFLLPIQWFVRNQGTGESMKHSRFYRGIFGEAVVRFELTKLDDRFFVFQGLRLPGRIDDIDYVVYGPTGIFVIEVKSHKGIISFNGNELLRNGYKIEGKDFIKQTMGEAFKLHNFLFLTSNKDLFVSPILCFSDPSTHVDSAIKRTKNIFIIHKTDLNELILSGNNTVVLPEIIDSLASIVN